MWDPWGMQMRTHGSGTYLRMVIGSTLDQVRPLLQRFAETTAVSLKLHLSILDIVYSSEGGD
jgi:hypothetical protein